MPVQYHISEIADGSAPLWSDRVILGIQNNIAFTGGADTKAVAVSFVDLPTDANGNGKYGVFVTLGGAQPAGTTVYVTNKTATGFTVNLEAGSALSAGTLDVLVIA